MRVKLALTASSVKAGLPLNSNHAIAAMIYHMLGNASADFAAQLHREGFSAEGRSFKLFTFSRLRPDHSHIVGDQVILDKPSVTLQISSPLSDFIEYFVTGLFQAESFRIAETNFHLTGAETLPAPEFTERMIFRALSPITESVRDEQDRTRFLSTDDDWSEVMQRNLTRKYRVMHGREPEDTSLRWTWDREYLREVADRGRRASALIDIRGIKVRGWLAPFTVEGNRELIEIGYETGFGSRNSMGFGMAEVS